MAMGQTTFKGTVSDAMGNRLPFAAIYLPDHSVGASANVDGYFEFTIPSQPSAVVVQYLGYRTVKKNIAPSGPFLEQDFVLEPVAELLQVAEVRAGKEDPAYRIMRQAIAKSKYHTLIYDAYTCRVYTKGTGMLTHVPRLMRSRLKKEGFEVGEAYTSEAISEITFKQPNTIEERVIAILQRKDDRSPSPSPYINQSFYKSDVAGNVSPLAPTAFFYYNFYYQGSFEENGNWINKIRVQPKTKGEGVFEGMLFIIEDTWAIHSLDLKTVISGFDLQLKQIYSPVVEDVWMPVNHRIQFKGGLAGIKFVADYTAVVSNYDVTLNPKLKAIDINLVDPKTDGDVAKAVNVTVQTLPDSMSQKDFKRMIRKIEKEERVDLDSRIISERTYSRDENAKKQDSLFWITNRPIALTDAESISYEKGDSIAAAEIADSNATGKGNPFQFQDIIFGNRYKTGPNSRIDWRSMLRYLQFNTVEGLVYHNKFRYRQTFGPDVPWVLDINPEVRYGFSSNVLFSHAEIVLRKRKYLRDSRFTIKGGRGISQFNPDEPIEHIVNSLYTLFNGQNFMKLYGQDYLEVGAYQNFGKVVEVTATVGHYQRFGLQNNTDFAFANFGGNRFTSNIPENDILTPENIRLRHQLTKATAQVIYRPFLKYRIYNSKKIPVERGRPTFTLDYQKGWYDRSPAGDQGFDHLALAVNGYFRFSISGNVFYTVRAGTFFNTSPLFHDWRHFDGNQTIFAPLGRDGTYRLLPYYDLSTNGAYLEQNYNYEFRKFVLTQLPKLRFWGVKEQVFTNVLLTGNTAQPAYWEIGYSADRIFRLFRFEVAYGALSNFPGFRIGLSSIIQFE